MTARNCPNCGSLVEPFQLFEDYGSCAFCNNASLRGLARTPSRDILSQGSTKMKKNNDDEKKDCIASKGSIETTLTTQQKKTKDDDDDEDETTDLDKVNKLLDKGYRLKSVQLAPLYLLEKKEP